MPPHHTITGKEAMVACLAGRIARDPSSFEVVQAMVGDIGGAGGIPCQSFSMPWITPGHPTSCVSGMCLQVLPASEVARGQLGGL